MFDPSFIGNFNLYLDGSLFQRFRSAYYSDVLNLKSYLLLLYPDSDIYIDLLDLSK